MSVVADLRQPRDVAGPLTIDTRRGTALVTVLTLGASFLAGPVVDQGTRVIDRFDYRSAMEGTSLTPVQVEGPVVPFQTPTRMARIRALAPLSLRDWGEVFGVSHSAIKQWVDSEPGREKLDRVLGALSEATAHQPDLARWLTAPLPGMEIRPLDLLRDDRWRAFRGAIRTRSAPAVTLAPDELLRRRQAQASWAVTEPPIVADDDA
jgi:hypothetical protein